ncbi:MAG: polysaccharide biosynthesis/export protein [Sphingomonadales bacterium]|jgi:polysaccharide export outer membrane protein|nr:polysaccharide biosynthesis/export protein [Sphingomonadales bacterium]
MPDGRGVRKLFFLDPQPALVQADGDDFEQFGPSVPLPTHSSKAGASPALGLAVPLRLLLAVLGVGMIALLGGCLSEGRGGKIPYAPPGFVAPDQASPTQALDDDYRISPLDTLKVSVFQVPDLSGDFDVDLTGNIAMPLIGNVKAVGLTTDELDQRITQALSSKYLQNPDVSVGVKKSSSRLITVEGSVRSPGVFDASNTHLTLLQVVAMAHGTDEDANPHRVAVFRQIQGQRMAAAFDLTDIRRGKAEDPRIYSGDIVVVDGSKVKAAWKSALASLPLLAIFRPFGI